MILAYTFIVLLVAFFIGILAAQPRTWDGWSCIIVTIGLLVVGLALAVETITTR